MIISAGDRVLVKCQYLKNNFIRRLFHPKQAFIATVERRLDKDWYLISRECLPGVMITVKAREIIWKVLYEPERFMVEPDLQRGSIFPATLALLI